MKMEVALNALGLTLNQSPLRWREWEEVSVIVGSEIKEIPFVVKEVPPLFPRIDIKAVSAPVAPPTEDPFAAIDLRAVKILSAEDHPNAEALYVLQVDAGEAEPRTVCAGLRKHLSKDEIVGKMAVLVANLKPASLRGVMSQGLLLAADGEGGKLSLAFPEAARSPAIVWLPKA